MISVIGTHLFNNKSPTNEFVKNASATIVVTNIPVVINSMSTDKAKDSTNTKTPLKYRMVFNGLRIRKNRTTRSTLNTKNR